ncbi:hypothetical protein [Effusibacillus dendaii]|uniref:Uncharacterized protein n=1 Tax=Effusibacillus dendaii TaxID=2743772 RepID=A0A7I8DA54_9BACL|nr:hypothetical protein [Effusibacillus dendaii]BCJ87063.1 hypothetical protein skT53_20480 [Effusibacillus dendaii]
MSSFTIFNWTWHMVALIGALLFCLPTFWLMRLARKFDTHKPIQASDVKSVRLFENGEWRDANPTEIGQIVNWFNASAFVQKRMQENPDTNRNGVAILLNSEEEILIVPRDGDFDVTRRRTADTSVTYWARNKEFSSFLEKCSI